MKKECAECKKQLDTTSFEKHRATCKKCVYDLKRKRAQERSKDDAPHVDACGKCEVPFHPDKFTWRTDSGTWRTVCHKCTTPASASTKYRQKQRDQDEEGYKEARRKYMQEYRAKNKEKKKDSISKSVEATLFESLLY